MCPGSNCGSRPAGRRGDRTLNSFDLGDVYDRLVAAKLRFGAKPRRLFGMVCYAAWFPRDWIAASIFLSMARSGAQSG